MTAIENREQTDVAFSAETKVEFEEILTHYPNKRAAVMPVLWLAQREFGWISRQVEAYVASLLEIPEAGVEGVVSFYTMYYRRPMGRHHIQVCTNLSCRLRGAADVLGAISHRVGVDPGDTTKDMEFSLDKAECLGACGGAPVVHVGDRCFEDVDVDKALELVDRLNSGEGG